MFAKNDNKPEFEMFTIFDTKVGVYKDPVTAINQHEVIRDFTVMMRGPEREKNTYYTNAEDFAIYKIGEWSRRTGVIKSINAQHVVNLHDLKSLVMREEKTLPLHVNREIQAGAN